MTEESASLYEIVFSHLGNVIYKTDEGCYYCNGWFPWGKGKIPIENIVKIFVEYEGSRIFVCTPDDCFAAGSNLCGNLGMGEGSPRTVKNFVKVNWYPIEMQMETWSTRIRMKDGKWYGMGALDGQVGFLREDFIGEIGDDEEGIYYPRELVEEILLKK